jgi:helix-turn-helix protein
MLAEQHDDELRAIWAALVAGRLTDDEAQAAAEAVQGRRRHQQGNDASEPQRPPPALRMPSSHRREKVFGSGRTLALDRNAKARITHLARCLMRRTEKGRAYGQVTAKAFAVLQALLWGFHNGKSGLCFPSYERIAEAAGCARSTVYEAISALEAAGLLTWANRLKRIREMIGGLSGIGATRSRVLRTSNGYRFEDPGNSSKSDLWSGTADQAFFSSIKGAGEVRRAASAGVDGAGSYTDRRSSKYMVHGVHV